MKHKIVDAWPNFTRVCFQFRSAAVFVFFFSIFFAHSSIAKIFFNCRGGVK